MGIVSGGGGGFAKPSQWTIGAHGELTIAPNAAGVVALTLKSGDVATAFQDVLEVFNSANTILFSVDSGGETSAIAATPAAVALNVDGGATRDASGGRALSINGNQGFLQSTETRLTVQGPQIAPGVPASTTPLVNPFVFACIVTVRGGTVSAVKVDGNTILGGDGPVVVPFGSSVSITYAVAPAWDWFGLS